MEISTNVYSTIREYRVNKRAGKFLEFNLFKFNLSLLDYYTKYRLYNPTLLEKTAKKVNLLHLYNGYLNYSTIDNYYWLSYNYNVSYIPINSDGTCSFEKFYSTIYTNNYILIEQPLFLPKKLFLVDLGYNPSYTIHSELRLVKISSFCRSFIVKSLLFYYQNGNADIISNDLIIQPSFWPLFKKTLYMFNFLEHNIH